ncbi:MAG: helix-turn-helix domain-containing protein [Elusimicrobiota bacterium]|jgi:DNA-binding XRE family transcriptional regulator|nr:helix-turn-helix domain-containing protein [Elusimicrobiota bacterium]MDR0676868.1 helix-turn-helix domain-containing protein [Elusimicrobiota bacterium]
MVWTTKMTFGEKIKKTRLEQFFTQKEMAKVLGVSTLSIIRWENEQSKPSLATQKKFHDYCKSKNIVF